MELLESITTGTVAAPRRILLYGTHGIGKSTFGAMADKPIFLQTEDGLGGIDCSKFPLTRSYDDAMKAIAELRKEKHEYKTIVIDSLDWLEKLIWKEVCDQKNVDNMEEIGFGKGYMFAMNPWHEFCDELSALRDERNMAIILIAHSRIDPFREPGSDTYDRYTPSLHRHPSSMWQDWCDEVLFATFVVHTKKTDEGFDRKRTHGVGSGERVIRTTQRPSHIGKNRLNLPEEIPLDWREFAKYLPGHEQAPEKGEKTDG